MKNKNLHDRESVMDDNNLWLTQKSIANLFDCDLFIANSTIEELLQIEKEKKK